MNTKTLRVALIACGMIAASSTAWASTATTTFNVTGTVIGACNVSAAPLSFGTAIPSTIAANIDVSANMSVTCTNAAPYTVALDVGTGSGATFGSRKMTSGANTMTYSLYTNSGHTLVWGDGTSGSNLYSGTGSGSAQSIPVYGQIPPQTVSAGSYTDTITVTLTY